MLRIRSVSVLTSPAAVTLAHFTRLAEDDHNAPAFDEVIRVLLAFSEDNSNFAGNVSGTDAAFSDEDELSQLMELRPLVLDGDTASQQVVGVFRTVARYVVPVIFNESGQSLSSTATDHELVIWPIEGVTATS